MDSDHRRLAIAFNGRTWELLEKAGRTEAEADEMVLAACASLAHWLKAGTGVNEQRGHWLIARVYADIGRLEPARYHLERTTALTKAHAAQLADFDFAFVDALAARVHALAGEVEQARDRYRRAKALGEALADPDDRAVFVQQLAAPPWFGFIP